MRWRSPTDRSRTTRVGSSASPSFTDSARASSATCATDCERGIASAMFSATVSDSNSEKCWNTMPMPSARAAAGLGIVTGSPRKRISPSFGCSAP